MLGGSIRFRQHTTISQLIKLFHLEDVSFVLWNLENRGKSAVMGQLTFYLIHFREEVNVIKSLLNFDHIHNSIQYGNSNCCKEYHNGCSRLGSKNGCPLKNVVWECFSCWPWCKSHLLACKNPLWIFSFLLAMDALHLFNKTKHFKKE